MLALGCDAPVGGPTKLLRKVFFVPPVQNSVPRIYAAAADLKHGLLTVAVYGDTIMLYSVASDIISDSQQEQEAISATGTTETAHSAAKVNNNHWRNWWTDSAPRHATKSNEVETSAQLWPIFVHGTEIGKLEGVCEIAVRTRPDLSIWAFTNSLQCRSWRLRNSNNPVPRTEHFICRDGGMHDLPPSMDGCEDIVMGSTLMNRRMCLQSPHDRQEEPLSVPDFDGHASGYVKRIPKALAIENDACVEWVDVRGCSDAWYDGDGDVVMYYGP